MKSCPKCGREYKDVTLNFCLEDGEWLVEAGRTDEPTTAILSGDDRLSDAATRQQFAITGENETAKLSDGTHIISRSSYPKNRFIIGAVAALLVIAAIGAWIFASYGAGKAAQVISLQSAKFTRLTNTGQISGGALSPDGKYLAHVVDDGDQQSLWLMQTAASSNVQIVPPAAVTYSGVAFSPDGNHLYYSVYENGNAGTLYQIPVLGGQPRKILTTIHSGPAFSPDGKQIAFFRVHTSGAGESIMIANADGSGERELASRSGDEEFFNGLFATVSWSPDGKMIATSIRNLPENYLTVATVSVDTGELKPVTDHRWFRLQQVAWMPDGNSILTAAAQRSTDPPQLWQISYPSGEAQQITNDLNGFLGVGLTKNADTIATVHAERSANISVYPMNDLTRSSPVTSGRGFSREMSWTPDGGIVYASTAGGNWDLFLSNISGQGPKRLTTAELADQFPVVTADGRYVVFMSDRLGPPHIWRMDIDGSNQTQLTHEGYNLRPQISPDGQTAFFESSLGKAWSIWKVPIAGGQPQPLNDIFTTYPSISPNGKIIAAKYTTAADKPLKLAIFSVETGELIKDFDVTFTDRELPLDWTPDGQAIAYVVTKKDVSNLWAQPVAGGPPKQITNFTSDRIFWFKHSPDGKQLAVSRGKVDRDVVLITNFK